MTEALKSLPKSVKVGYRTVHFKTVDERVTHALGVFNTRDGVIGLTTSQDDQELANTILHEIFHAVWHIYGLPHSEQEEQVVTTLSNGFSGVLRDNPKLFEVLARMIK